MTADLRKILVHLHIVIWTPSLKAAHATLDEILRASWRYKHQQLPPKKSHKSASFDHASTQVRKSRLNHLRVIFASSFDLRAGLSPQATFRFGYVNRIVPLFGSPANRRGTDVLALSVEHCRVETRRAPVFLT